MAYIDRLSHRASLFSIIHEYCDLEKQGDNLYLKPFNKNMDSMFKELGFVSPVDCKEFCQSWEDNTRAIGMNGSKVLLIVGLKPMNLLLHLNLDIKGVNNG